MNNLNRIFSIIFCFLLVGSSLNFFPPVSAINTTNIIPSVEAIIDIDTTTSSTYVDVVGLSVNITLTNTTDVFITSSIQTLGSQSAVASYRLVFDGVPYQGLSRQVGTLNGNIVLTDLVHDKPAGNYEIKVQHNVTAGTLSTINASVFAVQMHNGNGRIPANDSFVESDSISGTTQTDIVGLTTEITLQRTSYIWVALTWAGQYDVNNKEGNFTVQINGQIMETRFRKWGTQNQWGALSLMTRTDAKIPNGTHIVKGIWQGDTTGVLTGMNFSLVVIAGEADGTNAEFDISKSVVVDDIVTSTSLENIDGLTLNIDLENTTHVIGFLSMDTDTNKNNRDIYFTVNINGTNQEVLIRGHSVAASSVASVGIIVRSNTTFSTGEINMTGQWRTDAATTITGSEIILTSFVLLTENIGVAELTIVFHTGITQLYINDESQLNNSVISVTIGDTVNLTSVIDTNYVFFRYFFNNGTETHTHENPFIAVVSSDQTVHSYALFIGSDSPPPSSTSSYAIIGGIIGGIIAGALGFSMASRHSKRYMRRLRERVET